MSLIDRALTVREGAGAAAAKADTDTRAASTAALNRFSHEEPAHEEPPRDEPSGDVHVATPPSRREDGARPAQRDGSRLKAVRPASRATDPGLRARLVSTSPSAVSVEQYRRLAAVLHEAQEQSQLKTVMVTSALPGDGKTLTVANLALTLSESYGRRVLVIDADLRLPTLHTVLGIPNGAGLSEALQGGTDPAFVEISTGLSALTAGRPSPTPLAGLSSNRMRDVLLDCAARFDWVLIDTSPVGVLPDAQVIGRLVGAVLLVIGAGTTPAEIVQHAIAELGGPDSIFGIVLNRVEESRVPQADYYGQYRPAQE